MPDTIQPRVAEFGRYTSPGSWFLSKETDIGEQQELLPYSHYLRQAWSELELGGVLCVDGRPTVYFCEATHFSTDQKRKHHRFVWNQALVPLLVFVTPNLIEVHTGIKIPEKETVSTGLFEHDPSSLIPNLGIISEGLEIASFVRSVETGQFFQEHSDFFPTDQTVDRCLLKNLVHAARRLKTAGWDLAQAHALLGRALFVSFLHEREFIKPDYYPDGTKSLIDILSRPRVEDVKRLLSGGAVQRRWAQCTGT